MIYLDNAATSYPKPESVLAAVSDALACKGGNPGRSGHKLSREAGKILDKARSNLAKLFGAPAPERMIFCLNATDALNLAINGLGIAPGDRIITSSMEHNSVARPLEYLKKRGVSISKIKMDPAHGIDASELKRELSGDVKLVVLTHASNVTGTVNDIKEVGEICKNSGVTFAVDASQSAGILSIDIAAMGIDLLAFPGHKGLLGSMGTGGLYVAEGVNLAPLRTGGTGIHSEDKLQPEELPFKFEAGTANVPGIAGLSAGVEFILKTGLEKIRKKEAALTRQLADGLSAIEGVNIYGYPFAEEHSPVVSLNIEGVDCAEAALILDASFGIATRSGLHCAPDAHRTLGSLAGGGTLRISPGFMNEEEDILKAVDAIASIAAEGGK
jgi:cysteine desulfurase family protein